MALLEFANVSKTYSRGNHATRALRDVSLTIAPATMVAVYGQPGSGKSTLLRVAAGLEDPDAGTVSFAGEEIVGLSLDRRTRLFRRSIAWVDRAGPRGDSLRIVDYVALPATSAGRRGVGMRAARKRAALALEQVGASEHASAYWSELSDVARMSVALAHAIVREPRLLVLDDPTAGLGISGRELIMSQLRTLAEESGAAVLVAVPDASSTLRAHEVVAIARGRLIAPDPPSRGTVVQFPGGDREQLA